jgi:sulfur carrier protein ThiS
MEITLTLRDKVFTLDRKMSVKKALHEIGLSPESHLVLKDGDLLQDDQILKDGDVITIIPVISGG